MLSTASALSVRTPSNCLSIFWSAGNEWGLDARKIFSKHHFDIWLFVTFIGWPQLFHGEASVAFCGLTGFSWKEASHVPPQSKALSVPQAQQAPQPRRRAHHSEFLREQRNLGEQVLLVEATRPRA